MAVMDAQDEPEAEAGLVIRRSSNVASGQNDEGVDQDPQADPRQADPGQGGVTTDRSRRQSLRLAATAAAGAARRAHKRGAVVAARAVSEKPFTTASQKVGAVLADERTKALLAASARASARIAADALSRRGSESLASAVRAFADDGLTPAVNKSTPGVPAAPDEEPSAADVDEDQSHAGGPTAKDIASALAARRIERMRQSTPAHPMPGGQATTRQPAAEKGSSSPPYPTVPLQFTLGQRELFRLVCHPELPAFTVEVSCTHPSNYVLAIEWKDVASRFFFEIDDFPADWQRVEHESLALPLQLRRTGAATVGVSFLDPGSAAREREASRRESGRATTVGPSIGALQAAARRRHEDSMAVIRNTHA